ncbi:unnamed protein product [Linum tenue]|uniref:DUF2283 domain-containing protein n=1 Tax=Linum tenue TaxID=586396 RepID=A0AAV0H2L3_9ROSI|nr:unnamed protein product [Linum tenue]
MQVWIQYDDEQKRMNITVTEPASQSLHLPSQIKVRGVLVLDEHPHEHAVHPRVELRQNRGRRNPAAGSPPSPRLSPAEQGGEKLGTVPKVILVILSSFSPKSLSELT